MRHTFTYMFCPLCVNMITLTRLMTRLLFFVNWIRLISYTLMQQVSASRDVPACCVYFLYVVDSTE